MEELLDRKRIALGVKQPWLELILCGKKTLEIRSRPTNIRGRIYLYASRKLAREKFAHAAIERHDVQQAALATGVLLGSVEIAGCRLAVATDADSACVPEAVLQGQYAWILQGATRLEQPQPVEFLPYGVWFYPYQRGRDERGGRSQKTDQS